MVHSQRSWKMYADIQEDNPMTLNEVAELNNELYQQIKFAAESNLKKRCITCA
jgi:hypothetical protein